MEFQHELIIPDEGLPFKLFLFEGSSGNYIREKHWHTSVEIFTVFEGELFFYLNEKEHLLRPGEFLIINSNEVHSIQAPKENQTVVLQIPLKLFEDYFTAQRFIRFKQPVKVKSGERETELEPQDSYFAELIQEIYQIYEERELGYELRVRSLFYEIMYLLVNNYRETEAAEGEIRHSRKLDALSKITTYMREHYTEDLKLSQVASIFGYSAEYLSRLFVKHANVNFKTYLQDIRMGYAYRELLNTDHTISQIAQKHGFCSSRAFAKEYQKRYGILPSEQRQKMNMEK